MLRTRTAFMAAGAVGLVVSLVSGTARSADLMTKAPAASCVQAVDGVNGNVAGFGGSFANETVAAGEGSLAIPLGCEYGAQLDAMGGSFDNRFIGTLAGHLFWRNPTEGLLGAYGDYSQWDEFGGVRAAHIGPEAEWYHGQWTLQGVAGVEFGNTASGTIGTIVQTYSVPTRFFDQVNLAFYPQDNLEVYAGHRYLDGKNALALGGEWGIPMNHGVMAAPFVEARIGQGTDRGVWGGLRFYFGHKDKTLIRRHREDDPPDWNDGFESTSNGGNQMPVPTTTITCTPPDVLTGGVCRLPP